MAVIPSLILFLLNDYREGLSGPQLASARVGNFALTCIELSSQAVTRATPLAEELKQVLKHYCNNTEKQIQSNTVCGFKFQFWVEDGVRPLTPSSHLASPRLASLQPAVSWAG